MKHRAEFHTAYLVAIHGTVSATAEILGVHRATVIRHIDILEEHLGVKLFIRHQRGYTKTEYADQLIESAELVDNQYSRFFGKIRNATLGKSGELIIGATGPIGPLIVQAAKAFRKTHQDTKVRYKVLEDMPYLEFAEAHIVVWVGPKPTSPDHVPVKIGEFKSGLYAHKEYLSEYGVPKSKKEIGEHRFVVVSSGTRSMPTDWARKTFELCEVAFTSNCRGSVFRAALLGMGIGLLPQYIAASNPDMVRLLPDLETPTIPYWAVTHMDIHRTHKIQAYLQALKAIAIDPNNGMRGLNDQVFAI
ncbi:MAG: LysR family transcriptional regulator [Pseudomonadota bacterium]